MGGLFDTVYSSLDVSFSFCSSSMGASIPCQTFRFATLRHSLPRARKQRLEANADEPSQDSAHPPGLERVVHVDPNLDAAHVLEDARLLPALKREPVQNGALGVGLVLAPASRANLAA